MNENPLDRYLSASIREHIEQAYYAHVNEQAKLEYLIQNPRFWQNAARHPAFFSDHGVVHVRDVARQILTVLQIINGILIPRRSAEHMHGFMYGYGVVLTYLHDIGMSDFSQFGRAMHPEFAAQAVFGEPLDRVVAALWAENSGNLMGRVRQLSSAGVINRDPQIVFRELLSMSVGHSKSKIPVAVLDDPRALRAHMQVIISQDLLALYHQQQIAKGRPLTAHTFRDQPPLYVANAYSDFERDAFDWLTDSGAEAQDLVADVIDTLRALRCADALRQRGTVQKTSGGYEVFASRQTGNALFALRLGNDHLYLLEMSDFKSAGEANIASSEFTAEGNLRISFHRGSYDTEEALRRSVHAAAIIISDFLSDVVISFWRSQPVPSLKTFKEIRVLLESVNDNPRFAELVKEQLCQLNPEISDQIAVVPSLSHASELERTHYLVAKELDWGVPQRQALLERMQQAGQKWNQFDPNQGFEHVKQVDLAAGEKLLEAGAPAAFVYVPLASGLRIVPLGGYQSFPVAAWMPLGTTGVIRGDVRNADIIADQPVSVLIVPKDIYLRYWYAPYSFDELRRTLDSDLA